MLQVLIFVFVQGEKCLYSYRVDDDDLLDWLGKYYHLSSLLGLKATAMPRGLSDSLFFSMLHRADQ